MSGGLPCCSFEGWNCVNEEPRNTSSTSLRSCLAITRARLPSNAFINLLSSTPTLPRSNLTIIVDHRANAGKNCDCTSKISFHPKPRSQNPHDRKQKGLAGNDMDHNLQPLIWPSVNSRKDQTSLTLLQESPGRYAWPFRCNRTAIAAGLLLCKGHCSEFLHRTCSSASSEWGLRLENGLLQAFDLQGTRSSGVGYFARDCEILENRRNAYRRGRDPGRNVHRFIHMTATAADGESNSAGGTFKFSVRSLAVAVFFGGTAGFVHALLRSLPPDFLERWRKLLHDQPIQEPKPVMEPQPGTVIYDCHGVVIATIVPGGYSGKRDPLKDKGVGRTPLHPSDIPSAMWQAVVASEDRRFFEHHGIDPRGLTRAILSLASSGGGSTITQQLVKNVFLTNDRKWTRKLMEMILALLLEKQMTKWDILHLYLNKIYWGHGVYGIEAASALYFAKHPSTLTLGECAMLAGIIPAPELLSPYRDPSRGKKAQARSLRRMVEAGFLDPGTAAAAVNEPLCLGIEGDDGSSGPWRAPYFVSEVLYELYQKYGRDEVLRGGYQVHTTLDLAVQDVAEKVVRDGGMEYDNERVLLAEKAIERCVEALGILVQARQQKMEQASLVAATRAREQARNYAMIRDGMGNETTEEEREDAEEVAASLAASKAAAAIAKRFDATEKALLASLAEHQEEVKNAADARMEAAMVAIDPMSGAVRVLVGGRDYYESNFNRATQAFRPPGSTFKPVVYLTALAEGIERDHVLMDEPYTVGDFSPENYDKKFRGEVTLEESLLSSLNVPTVKLCAEIGVDKVVKMGKALGIETNLPHELSLSLGGCEVTPLQLTTVYSTIAAGGVYHKPHLISRVETHDGRILEEKKQVSSERCGAVVDEYAISELRSLLQAVVDRGTGRAARIGRPCAGKTGTSDGHRDVWFAGFTPMLSCVVWLGYDDNSPLGGLYPATGSSHAAPLWRQFMKHVHEGLPIQKFHDIGQDRYGGQAPRQFGKRSRRPHKIGLREIRKDYRRRDGKIPWRDVWDWEKASIAWEEREKMEEWTTNRTKRAEEILNMKRQWQKTLAKSGITTN